MRIAEWMNTKMFNLVHQHNLVYNTCWEDPRLDRIALELAPNDTVMVITSAGCNALDYVLTEPRHVYAVDVNPRQNALLQLKQSAIRSLEFEDFFRMFGEGRIGGITHLYADKLRYFLCPWARRYWDRWIRFFDHPKRPFYYRGASGTFARWMNVYADRVVRVRRWLDAILCARTIDEQRHIYHTYLRDRFWTRTLKFAMTRNSTLSMVGVPQAQRQQVEQDYDGGIVRFVQDCLEAVFAQLPLSDNYFWRVYLTGRYAPDCCPEYLKPDNFQRLKNGLVDRISTHTATVQRFLESIDQPISRFVLLDHMDWLSTRFQPALAAEWQTVVDRAAPGARIIWRSGGLRTDFVTRLRVTVDGRRREVGELLQFNQSLASELHARDRVHTYGSFHIAGLAA
jgi:S-adenosylmethionine-diacylglycerol 3-amino-3-carboxypropyl transferase